MPRPLRALRSVICSSCWAPARRSRRKRYTVTFPTSRFVVLVLVASLASVHSGCASAPPRMPPPPTEQLRAQLGSVAVVTGSSDAAMVFKGPATGGLEGAWRGMRIGFVDPILVGAKLSGPGSGAIPFLAGVGLAPVGALMGGVVGAVAAQPKAKMEEKGAVIRTALNELKIQEAFSGCASSALRERAPISRVAPRVRVPLRCSRSPWRHLVSTGIVG